MVLDTTQGITTLALQHSLGAEGGDALHQSVLDLLENGHRALVVDLLDITRIDAAGLGQLVRAYMAVCDRGGELRIVACRQVREVLSRTRLTTVVPTYASRADARASFASYLSCSTSV